MVCCTEGCCIRQCQVWHPMRFLLTCPMVACLQVGRACLLVSRACRPVATPWECHVKPSAPTTKHATTQHTRIVGEDPRFSQRLLLLLKSQWGVRMARAADLCRLLGRIFDEQQKAYYCWNETTGESRWDLPSPQATSPLPAAHKLPFAVPRQTPNFRLQQRTS